MTQTDLDKILESHKQWLINPETGTKADLHGADLRYADLHGANLQDADLRYANLQDADLHGANLHGANLHGADLQDANLQDANLHGADLHGANWDYSCFPLWCGGSHFKCDSKLVYQLFAHICTLEVTDCSVELQAAILAIRPMAELSHRTGDLLKDE